MSINRPHSSDGILTNCATGGLVYTAVSSNSSNKSTRGTSSTRCLCYCISIIPFNDSKLVSDIRTVWFLLICMKVFLISHKYLHVMYSFRRSLNQLHLHNICICTFRDKQTMIINFQIDIAMLHNQVRSCPSKSSFFHEYVAC